jgi:hypothetical protein
MSPGDLAALEDDRPPSSSRRPISLEEKMAEEDDAVPLHPPPPKSGRLPAASPSIEMGFDADPSTGVRRYDELRAEPAAEAKPADAKPAEAKAPEPKPIEAKGPEAPKTHEEPEAALAASPAATAVAPAGVPVARFIGRAPRELAAATFGELLDASLEI